MRITKFLDEAPLFALYHAHDVILGDFQRRLAAEGVHFIQALILTGIFFEGRAVRPSELALVLKSQKSNISHALRSLERQGLLQRTTTTHDARAYLFDLTRDGKKRALRLIKLFDNAQDALERELETKRAISALVGLVKAYRATSPNLRA